MTISDWDDAYANRAHIPGADAVIAAWEKDAAAFRGSLPHAQLDIPYGDAERQRLDLFHPKGPSRGLAVFVHGGYWLFFDKSYWSHFAAGAQAAGWTVAVPSYTLAPAARVGDISREIANAITVASALVDGPIRLSGHSAGGQIVTRLCCADLLLAPEVAVRIQHVLSISGVHDLRPLMATSMNDSMRIDDEEARRESPALLTPATGSRLTAWVGTDERPEFLRQNDLLASAWSLPGIATRVVHDDGMHHFSVLDGLRKRESPITMAFTGEDGWS